ncbi:MAG TPA: Na+/H+ antiporter NhaA [Pseudonocardiaceae bacterium]|nr:Na+/H+ antiporter NhaA [Pseudonocardiaceae bacterium]
MEGSSAGAGSDSPAAGSSAAGRSAAGSSATGSSTEGNSTAVGRSLAAQVAAPLRRYLSTEAGSAGVLLAATVLALLWANSWWSDSYATFWDTELGVRIGTAELVLDLRHWVNDGLMVFFFFVVGLEVKRELVMGELADRRRAAVPLAAAVAGLVVPALIFLAFNPSGPAAQAWGVVISTDTAFLLGVLALVGPACPTQLRLFLLTLAVADDIGALAIIAVFYTDDLALGPLAVAVGGLGLMYALRYLRVWRGPAYFVLAVAVWTAMHESGVHPTIAGVVIALFSPAYPPRREEVEDADRLARAFRQSPNPEFARAARLSIERSVSPNERLQRLYHPWTSFVVVPIFALANAGVTLDSATLRAALVSPLTLGVVAGLVLGKLIGVLAGALGAVRLRLGVLAPGLGAVQLAGGAALSGIGFTISLFIVDLALDEPVLADRARVGVLTGSLLAALVGWLLFRTADRRRLPDGPAWPGLLDPPVDPARDHLRGPADASLSLVEYGDFECPFCGRVTGVVEQLRERFGDQLRYVFRHVPLVDVHPHAELAAEAAEAAGAQGRFWQMHDRLFSHQDELSPVDLLEHAAALGLDLPRFTRDLGRSHFAPRVREDVASAEASGVRGTPTFFIGARRHSGPSDADTLAARLLESASTDGNPGPFEEATPAATAPRRSTGGMPPIDPSAERARHRAVASWNLPEWIEETPDRDGGSPRLTSEQLALLERYGSRLRLDRGQVLFREGDPGYDFFAVLDGTIAIVKNIGRDGQRIVSAHGAGRFVGELNVLTEEPGYLTAVAAEAAELIRVPSAELRRLFDAESELGELVLRAFLLRRARLLGMTTDLRVIGHADQPDTRQLRELVERLDATHSFLDLDEDTGAADLLAELGVEPAHLPVVIDSNDRVLRNPSDAQIVDTLSPDRRESAN